MVMTIVPQAIGAFAGVERIQNYLLRPSLRDERRMYTSGDPAHLYPAISIQQLAIGDKQLILEDIDIEFPSGSLSMISGPVGCGKSTLLQALLGEIVPVHGFITVSTKRIGYCAQTPWLPRGTIKEAILHSTSEEHDQWYREVIDACCLAHDFEMLPKGDQTEIGSRGLNLSGGQRQRVVLLSY
jgi:ABC-type bacteriocin/lantibiotic exporter with double-glycine peptidase domain